MHDLSANPVDTQRSAEGVTKFLRSKNPVLDIIARANALIDHAIELKTGSTDEEIKRFKDAQQFSGSKVYFPNRTLFILELLCDRVNDSSAFKTWKFQPEFWTLFSEVWKITSASSNETRLRNKTFKRVKIVEVLIQILNSSDSRGLWTEVFEFINLIKSDYYIDIDDFMATTLLKAYFSALTKSDDLPFPRSDINNWSDIVHDLYQLPNLNINHSVSKKSYTRFVQECVPSLLKYVTAANVQLDQSKIIAEKLLISGLFQEEMLGNFQSAVEHLLKTSLKELTPESVSELFKLSISNLSSKHLKVCEDLFILITSTEKFHELSSKLLETLSSTNKSLSTEFFQQIYTIELDEKLGRVTESVVAESKPESDTKDKLPAHYQRKKSNTIDWDLIIHLVDLDIELTMKYSQDIISLASSALSAATPKSSKSKSKSKSVPKLPGINKETLFRIGKSILHSYLKGRELSEFLTTVWISAIKLSSVWKEQPFVTLVSETVDDFSSSQLNKLLEELFNEDKELVLPLITAILKGYVTSSVVKTNGIKDIIYNNRSYFNNTSESFWEARYYLLSNYDDLSLIDVSLIKQQKKSKYYFYTVFRLIELGLDIESLGISKSLGKHFIEMLKSNTDELDFVLSRWILVIENHLDEDSRAEFIKVLFNQTTTDLFKYFEEHGEIFFEQKSLTSLLIASNNNLLPVLESQERSIQLVQAIPQQCFGRNLKKLSIEALYEIAIASKDLPAGISSREAILHLLQVPSRSKLELEFGTVLELLKTYPTVPISSQIFKAIWLNHMAQFTDPDHEKYVTESLMKIVDTLPTVDHQITSVLEASDVIISCINFAPTPEKLQPLYERLIDSHASALISSILANIKKSDFSGVSIEWLLESLLNTIDFQRDDKIVHLKADNIMSLVKAVGAQLPKGTGRNFDLVQKTLFKLITRVSSRSIKDSIYVLSLYYALKPNVIGNDELERYLKFLETENFDMLFSYALDSASKASPTEFVEFIYLLCGFIRSTKKSDDWSQSYTLRLVNQSLSLIISNLEFLDARSHEKLLSTLKISLSDMTWLFNQYGIESLLTLISKYGSIFLESSHSLQTTELYISVTQVMSHVLLFHRYKLSSRHHIIINSFVALLTPLSLKTSSSKVPSGLSDSKDAASSYARLLANLCEPSVSTISREHFKNSLNSSSALAKRALRKHAPILLVNYIYLNLKYNFKSIIHDEIIGGIYSIFDVLSNNELQLVSSSLDIPGKSYYKTLYGNYKDHGKWRDD